MGIFDLVGMFIMTIAICAPVLIIILFYAWIFLKKRIKIKKEEEKVTNIPKTEEFENIYNIIKQKDLKKVKIIRNIPDKYREQYKIDIITSLIENLEDDIKICLPEENKKDIEKNYINSKFNEYDWLKFDISDYFEANIFGEKVKIADIDIFRAQKTLSKEVFRGVFVFFNCNKEKNIEENEKINEIISEMENVLNVKVKIKIEKNIAYMQLEGKRFFEVQLGEKFINKAKIYKEYLLIKKILEISKEILK